MLYELGTGKDRQEFPDLPTSIGRSSEREELLELNEILVKACADNPHHRYASAKEMRADLALLESGRSIKRLRAAERRFAQARRDRESRAQIQKALNRAEKAEQSARQARHDVATGLTLRRSCTGPELKRTARLHSAPGLGDPGVQRQMIPQPAGLGIQRATSDDPSISRFVCREPAVESARP